MKRGGVLLGILLLIVLVFPTVFAANPPEIDNAYTCLKDKINSSGCKNLPVEQQVFSLLAVGECEQELINASASEKCWPETSCTLKDTSQAILALTQAHSSYNSTLAEEWLLSNTKVPENLNWFLEIETNEPSTCKIYYDGEESGVTVNIDENKKLSSSRLGSCLSLAKGNYLIEVSSSCYNMEIDVSCDEGFLTTLIFQMDGSTTLNVLDTVQESSTGGTTTEKINSLCFKNPSANSCDYKGSLWASEVLFYLDRDVSEFLPYLVAFSEDNENLLPESFLYYLTGKFKPELLSKQVRNKYWIVSGDEYYDTALALLPLQYDSSDEKQYSKDWLLDVQEESGCWDNGNLRNTAFVLYSIWPEDTSTDEESVCGDGAITGDEECDGTKLGGESCESLGYESGDLDCYSETSSFACTFDESDCVVPETCEIDDDCPTGYYCSNGGTCYKDTSSDYECEIDDDCEDDEECSSSHICVEKYLDCIDEEYFCMSAIDCPSGKLLSGYECSGISKCCREPKSYGTCFSQKGEICNEDETCKNGNTVDADNLDLGEVCCLSECVEINGGSGGDEYTCEDNGGTCRTSCLSDEEESSSYSCQFGDACCFSKKKNKTTWFIWVLIALILIAVLGIVFREKIRDLIMKMKHKKKKSPGPGKPLFGGLKPLFQSRPPGSSQKPVPRRILPPSYTQGPRPKVPPKTPSKTSKDLDEVLKKLREMGK